MTMNKTVLILGFSGQDAYFLTDFLLEKGYQVVGMVRRVSTPNNWRYKKFENNPSVRIVSGDITDITSLIRVISTYEPIEIYNLAAQSYVGESFNQPLYTVEVDGKGALNLLEACRLLNSKARIFQASTSELFGSSPPPQNETTPFHPRSPYACAKALAYYSAVNYREAYGMFVSNGITFNHESEVRGLEFFTMKVIKGLCDIKYGKAKGPLIVGNLDFKRDWGFAEDYVEAFWLMLQQDKPDDFVIATGKSYSGYEFVGLACAYLGMKPDNIVSSQTLYRPSEVDHLRGDASKANRVLGWRPKLFIGTLVKRMCEKVEEIYKNGGSL